MWTGYKDYSHITAEISLDVAHVQSYIFAMDKLTLDYLIECDIFNKNYVLTFDDAIWKKEGFNVKKNYWQ